MASNKNPTKALDKAKRLPVGDISEVQEFVDIKQELESFRAEHPEVFTVYADLVDRYNTALEKADAVVRSQAVTCGPFENFSVSHVIDAEKMFDELGEKAYLANGGQVTKRTVYTIDVPVVEAAIASGKIPEGAVENFRTKQLKYHVPKKISG